MAGAPPTMWFFLGATGQPGERQWIAVHAGAITTIHCLQRLPADAGQPGGIAGFAKGFDGSQPGKLSGSTAAKDKLRKGLEKGTK